MKKIFIILLSILLLAGCSFFNKEEQEPQKEQPTTQKEPSPGDSVDVTETETKMFTVLIEYGTEIYEKKDYKKLKKQEDGTYFISVNDLMKIYNYDISVFDLKCNFDESGVVIDIDRLVHTNISKDAVPVVGMLSCNESNK